MRRLLKAPVVFMGLSLPEHGYHAINENYDWGQASRRGGDVLPVFPGTREYRSDGCRKRSGAGTR